MPGRTLSEKEFEAIKKAVLDSAPPNMSEETFNKWAAPQLAAAIEEAETRPAPIKTGVAGLIDYAKGIVDVINPITMAKGIASAVSDPKAALKAENDALAAERSKAADAFHEGRYSEALGHGVAGVLPLVGPAAANIGEEIASGEDTARGLGHAVGTVGLATGVKEAPGTPKALAAKTGPILKSASKHRLGLMFAGTSAGEALAGPVGRLGGIMLPDVVAKAGDVLTRYGGEATPGEAEMMLQRGNVRIAPPKKPTMISKPDVFERVKATEPPPVAVKPTGARTLDVGEVKSPAVRVQSRPAPKIQSDRIPYVGEPPAPGVPADAETMLQRGGAAPKPVSQRMITEPDVFERAAAAEGDLADTVSAAEAPAAKGQLTREEVQTLKKAGYTPEVIERMQSRGKVREPKPVKPTARAEKTAVPATRTRREISPIEELSENDMQTLTDVMKSNPDITPEEAAAHLIEERKARQGMYRSNAGLSKLEQAALDRELE